MWGQQERLVAESEGQGDGCSRLQPGTGRRWQVRPGSMGGEEGTAEAGRRVGGGERRAGGERGHYLCFSPPSSSPSLNCLVFGSASSLSCKGRERPVAQRNSQPTARAANEE